jgi:hypothetical protein
VRTRTPGLTLKETGRLYRYTTITCLLCDVLVYRVYQTYTEEVEGKEGPLLPTEDWAERDVLKSISGWVQVNKSCKVCSNQRTRAQKFHNILPQTTEAIEKSTSSQEYSPIFSVILPPLLATESQEPLYHPSPPIPSSPPPAPQLFANLKPVFQPPPFTPSHPVYIHLSSLATQRSQALRDAAEQRLMEQLQNEIAAIDKLDSELRTNVDRLWKKFREGVAQIQAKHPQPVAKPRPDSREKHSYQGTPSKLSNTPRQIRDFTPTGVQPAVFSPPGPRLSALSASLKTTSFHHPKASQEFSSGTQTNDMSFAAQDKGKASSVPDGDANVLNFRRNFEDQTDYATSYRYFVIKEADEARQREQLAKAGSMRKDETNGHKNQAATSGDYNAADPQQSTQKEKAPNKPELIKDDNQSHPKEKSKTKRVSFIVQPDVVTIKREVNAEKAQEQTTDDPAARGGYLLS